jgi:hypothetical protein
MNGKFRASGMEKIVVVFCLAGAASLTNAALIADWTFEANEPSATTSASFDYGAADSGNNATGSDASAFHASSISKWTFPSGDGSAQSFSGDHWAVGDSFQFKTSTAGYSQINISFEQISSSTGPTGFKLAYSLDGTSFSDISGDSYTVSNPSSINWASTGSPKATIENFDLSGVTQVNNNSTIYFSLIATTAGGSSTGTSRLDDFSISSVPEPATWGLISAVGLLGICGLREWRQNKQSKAL